MWQTSKQKNIFIAVVVILVIILAWGLVRSIQKIGSPDDLKGDQMVLVSSKILQVGETFTVSVPAGKDPQTVEIFMDGIAVKSCETTTELCEFISVPFTWNSVGTHTYEVIFSGEDLDARDGGRFVVEGSEVAEADVEVEVVTKDVAVSATADSSTDSAGTAPATPTAPATIPQVPLQYDKIVTSGNELSVGELFSATIYVKPTVLIDKTDYYIDNFKYKTCEGATSCGYTVGPMSNGDVGGHSYKFVVVSRDDQVLTAIGQFEVLPAGAVEEDEPAQPVPPVDPGQPKQPAEEPVEEPVVDAPAEPVADPLPSTLNVSANKDIITAGEKVQFSVDIEPGDFTVNYINFYVNSQVVKVCDADCEYEGGPYTDYAGLQVNYQAIAYFNEGGSLNSGLNYINVEEDQSTITISITPPSKSVGAFDDVSIFSFVVPAGGKEVSSHGIYINDILRKNCPSSNKCTLVDSPTDLIGNFVINDTEMLVQSKATLNDGSSLESLVSKLLVIGAGEPL